MAMIEDLGGELGAELLTVRQFSHSGEQHSCMPEERETPHLGKNKPDMTA